MGGMKMPRINSEYRKEAKEKIIAAALEIAAERGWDEVSLDAIARKVGTSKPALYNYFRSREVLLRDVLFEVFRTFRADLETTLSHNEDIHSEVRNLAELVFEREKPRTNLFFQIPLRLMQDNESGREFARIFDNSRKIIRDCLERAKTRKELFEGTDTDEAACTIIAMLFGLHVSSPFMGMDTDMKKKIWIKSVERFLLITEDSSPVKKERIRRAAL
jgi:AcrR family transcriptional regulator